MNLYSVLGLLIIIIFYGGYFTKGIIQGRKGIKTDRMARGNKPRKTFVIEVVLKIITYLTAIVQVATILFTREVDFLIQGNTIRIIGGFIGIAGVSVFIVAMTTMSDSWRAGIDESQSTKIIKTGIYKYSRNPAFLGFDLFYIGIGLMFSGILNIIIALIAIIILHFQILEEEKFLPTVFGEEYSEYKSNTRRYI
ncbi:MAG: isoprenylcysteine carboxylmethyltransferase family protein [Clostridium sp.]